MRNSHSRIERINDPERPTYLDEVVQDIIAEERERKQARRNRFLPTIVAAPCPYRPTANEGHWWVYPPQGVRGRARCKFCGEVK